MKRSPMPARKAPMKRRSRGLRASRLSPEAAERKRAEFQRAYGGHARVAWMKARPCAACGRPGPSDVAHLHTGGMGRKDDACRTVPLCRPCHGRQEGRTAAFECENGMEAGYLDALAAIYDDTFRRTR